MKLLKIMLVGLTGLVMSGYASAQVHTQELGSGSSIVLMGDCDIMANDVTVTLSGGVRGGVNCDMGQIAVGLSTCHTAGLTSTRSTRFNDGDEMPSGTCNDSEGCIDTASGSGFPSASTVKGTVASRFPGNDAVCSSANAVTQAGLQITTDFASLEALIQ